MDCSLVRTLLTAPMVNPSGIGGREGRTQITATSTITWMGREADRREGRKEGKSFQRGIQGGKANSPAIC